MTDLDWISFRAAQSYPLADEASGVSLTGNALPQSFLLDIQLLLPSKYNEDISGSFYISYIQDLGNTFNVVFAYSGIDCAICTGISKELTMTSSVASRTYVITSTITDTETLQTYPWMNNITGNLCAGVTSSYSGGSLSFDLQGAKLNASCVHFLSGDHVQAIQVDDKYLTGIVTIKAEEGIKLEVADGNVIKLSVDKIFLNTLWQNNIAEYQASLAGTPIKSINGVIPDNNGNIVLSGVDCVQTAEIPNGITISNPCAKPCCKADASVETLNTSIKILQQQHKTFRDYWVNMANVVNYMQANLSTLMNQR